MIVGVHSVTAVAVLSLWVHVLTLCHSDNSVNMSTMKIYFSFAFTPTDLTHKFTVMKP